LERIDNARYSGARELVRGEPSGQILPPHVFGDVTNDMELAREEIFGPIAPIIRARDEDDALAIANWTQYGLAGAVFTADRARAARFAQHMQVGMAHVNDQSVIDLPTCPFGGQKNSGIGRFNGEWAIEAFTSDQWETVQRTPRHYPWTAPKCRVRGHDRLAQGKHDTPAFAAGAICLYLSRSGPRIQRRELARKRRQRLGPRRRGWPRSGWSLPTRASQIDVTGRGLFFEHESRPLKKSLARGLVLTDRQMLHTADIRSR